MRNLFASAVLGLLLIPLAPNLAFGFKEKLKSFDKRGDFIQGHRVVRPGLSSAALTLNARSTLGEIDVVKIDNQTRALRVLAGQIAHAPVAYVNKSSVTAFVKSSLDFIAAHGNLFPGLEQGDLRFDSTALVFDKEDQFLKFRVYRQGLPIEDAAIDFRYKFGQLVQIVNLSFSEAKADSRPAAKGLVDSLKSTLGVAAAQHLQQINRVVMANGGYHLVKADVFEISKAGERFHVQIESATGRVTEVAPLNHYLDGAAHGQVYDRYYKEPVIDVPFAHLKVILKSGSTVTDASGKFNAVSGDQPKLNGFAGIHVNVDPETGALITRDSVETAAGFDLAINKEGAAADHEDKAMAQAMIFHHTNQMVNRAKAYIQIPWFESALTANANLGSTCNAHWDGQTINFYSADDQCANTGLISDVVFHEWGHGLDHNTGGIEDGAYSEGFGDIMSLVMTGSNILGIGFLLDGGFVRDLEPNKNYPDDAGEVHDEGLIIGSTFWDLYQALAAKHGEPAARELLAKYSFKMISTAARYTEVYDALTVIDDNDANPNNGTPNLCLINEVFTAHGLSEISSACQLGNIDQLQITEVNGNGNGVIEPGENASVKVSLFNNTAAAIQGLTGTGRLITPVSGIDLSADVLTWDEIATQSSLVSSNALSLDISDAVACGQSFKLAFNLKTADRDVVINRDMLVGRLMGEDQQFAASGLPLPVLDDTEVKADLNVAGTQWDATTTILKAKLKVDITHTFRGDLDIYLVSPAGEEFTIFLGTGSDADIHLDMDLSAMIGGKLGAGTWTLKVKDTAPDDEGTLDHVELNLTPAVFKCE